MRYLGGVLSFSLVISSYSASAKTLVDAELDRWIADQYNNSKRYLANNISAPGTRPGTVLASPSRHDPDYYYHWVRDAGLTMLAQLDTYKFTSDQNEKNQIQRNLHDYWRLTLIHQNTRTHAGLGEVKFYVNGSAFLGPWGRPQNDGPAIRALSLIKWWDSLNKLGSSLARHHELYHPNLPAHSAIKKDLEYTSHHWRAANFDVWEEIKGDHFFTRLFQYYALKEGSRIALAFDDSQASLWYLDNARKIKETLNRHWNEGSGFIEATLNRVGGIDYKTGLDSAIVIAVLESQEFAAHGQQEWTVLDDKVQSTVNRLENVFEFVYEVNSDLPQDKGPLIGRYPNDAYDGHRTGSAGNPWFLNTHYTAEFYYRLAAEYKKGTQIKVTNTSLEFWRKLDSNISLSTIASDSNQGKALIQGLIARGDSILRHTRQYVGFYGNMSEQINRNTGHQQGAHDLSWSYSSFMRAVEAREAVLD